MQRILSRTSIALMLVTLIVLAWATLTMTTEYFDAYEYILDGQRMWGDSGYWHPKNPIFSFFTALLYAPYALLSLKPSLLSYHLPMFIVHVGFLYFTARWLRRFFPEVPFFLAMGFVAWNRIFIHYMPFTHPDLFTGLCVALWLLIDAEVPADTWKGRLLRIAALGVIAAGRVHTVIIPIVSMLWNAWKTRRLRPLLEISLGSLMVYIPVFGAFFALGQNVGFWDGILAGIDVFLVYGTAINKVFEQPAYVYAGYIFNGLRPVGFGLLVFGIYEFWRQRRQERYTKLIGPMLGSLAYFIFLLLIGMKEARYLSQIFPAFAVLECFAFLALSRVRPWIGLTAAVALFATMAPELWHFTDPYYRADIGKTASENIVRWSKSNSVVFIKFMSAQYPKEHYFHWNDTAFYIQHWAPGAFMFHTGMPFQMRQYSATFQRYGYPIPDNPQTLAPMGVTMVLPAPQIYTTMDCPDSIQPIYALRWWTRGQEPAGTVCEPRVGEVCLEVYKAFEGFHWSS